MGEFASQTALAVLRTQARSGLGLSALIAFAGRGLSAFSHALKYRFHPRHRYNVVHTRLPPGYYDQDYRLLHACFALLLDYAEEEAGTFGTLNGGSKTFEELTEEHIRDLETEPHKWTGHEAGNPAALKAMQGHIDKDREILALYRWWTVERPATQARLDEMRVGKSYFKLSEQFEEQEQVMLERLVKIRRALWV